MGTISVAFGGVVFDDGIGADVEIGSIFVLMPRVRRDARGDGASRSRKMRSSLFARFPDSAAFASAFGSIAFMRSCVASASAERPSALYRA